MPSTNVVKGSDEILLNVKSGSSYSTRRTAVSNLTASVSGTNLVTFPTASNTPALTVSEGGIFKIITTNNPGASYFAGDFNAIVLGTNYSMGAVVGGAGRQMLVPNNFQMVDGMGNMLWFCPDHAGSGGGPMVLMKAFSSIVLDPGFNGQMQIGASGGNKNAEIYLQYNDTGNNGFPGQSALLEFRTLNTNANNASAAIHGVNSQANDHTFLDFYTKAPTWNTSPTPGFSAAGNKVMRMMTNGLVVYGYLWGDGSQLTNITATNFTGYLTSTNYWQGPNLFTNFNLRGRVASYKTATTNATAAVDFYTGLLQDVTASTNTLSLTVTNNDGAVTNLVRKVLYVHAGFNDVTLTWPGSVNVLGTALPATLTNQTMVRAEFEATGPGNTNVQVWASVGTDYTYAYDSDAAAFFTAAGITNATQKAAVNTFCANRKTHGTWNSADRIAVFVGGTSNAHTKYLKGSSTMTFSNAPTHAAAGITFNGTNQYALTGFVPSTDGVNFLTNNSRLLVCVGTNSAYPIADGTDYTGGSLSSYNNIYKVIGASNLDGTISGQFQGGSAPIASGVDRGVFMVSRTNTSSVVMYGNTLSFYNNANTATNACTTSFAIGGRHWGSGTTDMDHYSAFTCTGWEVGAGVDTTTWQSIRDDWLALNAALSR